MEREEINNKINEQSGLIISIEEKLKNLQYGANAQKRVEFVQNMTRIDQITKQMKPKSILNCRRINKNSSKGSESEDEEDGATQSQGSEVEEPVL